MFLGIFKIFILTLVFDQLLASSISGHITKNDREKLKNILDKSFQTIPKDDFSNIFYLAKSYTLLKTPITSENVKISCDKLIWSSKLSFEVSFHLISAFNSLKCQGTLPTKEISEKIVAAINEKASSADIYFGLEILKILGTKGPDGAKIVQFLQSRLKTDDSLISFGYAFHAASLLGSQGQFAFDRIEDIVVQADEIDNQMLQFEGGLAVTSLLLSGMVRLSESLKKQVPLTPVQVEKFSNYILSRRTVQSPKGIYCLLEASKAIIDTKMSPACISVYGSGQVTAENPVLKIQICDLMGNPLKLEPVVAQSATRLIDDVVVLSKEKLLTTSDPTIYTLNLKHEPGRYKIALTAGSYTATVSATILGKIEVKWLEIGVGDSDQSSTIKMNKIQHPNALKTPLEADSHQRILIKFSLGGKIVHQSFIQLLCEKTKREITFVAEPDQSGLYKFDLDIGSKASELGIFSGKYKIEVILGDAILSNAVRWVLGEIEFNLGSNPDQGIKNSRTPSPEIIHMFREPEKRPSQIISTAFTALSLAPILVLIGLWIKIGINIKNFRINLSTIGFHLGLAAIFGLFAIFWLKLDMFVTCRWLLLFGGITFVSGNRLLRSLSSKKLN